MKTELLLEYLATVFSLEKEKRLQEETIMQLNADVSNYEKQIQINNAASAQAKQQQMRSDLTPETIAVDTRGRGVAAFGMYYLGFLGAILLGGAANLVTKGNMVATILLGAVGAVIGICIVAKGRKAQMDNRKAEAYQRYKNLQTQDAQAQTARDKQTKALQLAIPRTKNSVAVMYNAYQLTCNTLKKYYDKGIIPQKYRSLVPVSMFYDYILNRRTYCLEKNEATFDEGAINMYERELRNRIIIAELARINQNLEAIRAQQAVLYQEMCESNARRDRLLTDIRTAVNDFRAETNENLSEIKYQQKQQLQCQQYMANAIRYNW